MLALKQEFEDVKGELIENQLAQNSANDALYAPQTAYEREQYFDQILRNPDMSIYDNDEIAWKLGDTGNEEAFLDLKDRADMSSGQLGLNHALEAAVDKNMQRVNGSLSQNLSEGAQEEKNLFESGLSDQWGNWGEGDQLALSTPQDEEPALNMPEIAYMLEEKDPNVAIQAVYFELAEMGIDPNELDQAMKAGNDYDVLDSLTDVAEKNGLHDIARYGHDVQHAYAQAGIPEAIQNIAPEITQIQPAFAMNDPRWDAEEQEPAVQALSMG